MLLYRWKSLTEELPAEENLLSRDLALFTAAVVLIASAVIILAGTSAPIFGQSVDTFFYNEMHVPLAVIIGFLNGISLLLKWKQTRREEFVKKIIFPGAASVFLTILIAVFGGITDIMMILLALSASFALLVNAEIAVRIIRGNMRMLGAYVAHTGIALFILGVIGSAAYSDQVDINLVKNQPADAFGYQLTYTGYEPIENNTKYAFNIELKRGEKSYKVAPVMYISDFNDGLMREPAILTMLTKDFYVSPLGLEEPDAHSHNGTVVSLEKGHETEFNGVKITFNGFSISPETMQAMQEGKDFEMGAKLTAEYKGVKKDFELKRKSIGGQIQFTSESFKDFNLNAELLNLAAGKIELSLSPVEGKVETVKKPLEILTVTASVKPFINLVWAGVAVMVFGFFISVFRRLKESLVNTF
jgi:cytochrome c-type biogenesis protein CcmF